jgi:hypothetical protein
MDQGFGREASSVADILEMNCEATFAGDTVALSSTGLYAQCEHHLTWSAPNPYKPVTASSIKVKLDGNGDATVVLWGGPHCQREEAVISGHVEKPPYTTVTTTFSVLPPRPTQPGVAALPSSEAEDSIHRSAATILQLEFPPEFAEEYVTITAPALERRCSVAPHLLWFGAGARELAYGKESVLKVQLDNDGNAFVVVLAGASCARGESLILATLEEAPYIQFTTIFTVLQPEQG